MAEIHRLARNWGARVLEFQAHGMDLVVLENERIRVSVLAGRGADVLEFNLKSRDVDFVPLRGRGASSIAPVQAASIASDHAFLDTYVGGWQEILPNGGAPSQYGGARFGQHDEVSNLPWDYRIVEDTPQRVSVAFSVRTYRTPFHLERQVWLDQDTAELRVVERLRNESNVDVSAMWGQHIVFGRPFLDDSCEILVGDGALVIPHDQPIHPDSRRIADGATYRWPHALGPGGEHVDLRRVPEPGTPSDIFYLTELPVAEYAVWSHRRALGLRVAWRQGVLPYLWYWQEPASTRQYPWWARDYLLGLEPFSSYPTNGLDASLRNGTALRVVGGGAIEFDMRISVLTEMPTLRHSQPGGAAESAGREP
jgi:Domain of unknown function (DUF4432)